VRGTAIEAARKAAHAIMRGAATPGRRAPFDPPAVHAADPLMPTWTEWLGYAAACLTTAAFVPQAWLTFRTRDVSGISLGMYAVFTAGIALWLAYGLVLGAWPIVVANSITLALSAAILGMKLVLGGRPSDRATR
jgi:MtN3 and saliva related transmembrane protein